MSIGPEGQFLIDDTPIQSVSRFKYLGSIVTSDGTVDAELITRLSSLVYLYSLNGNSGSIKNEKAVREFKGRNILSILQLFQPRIRVRLAFRIRFF